MGLALRAQSNGGIGPWVFVRLLRPKRQALSPKPPDSELNHDGPNPETALPNTFRVRFGTTWGFCPAARALARKLDPTTLRTIPECAKQNTKKQVSTLCQPRNGPTTLKATRSTLSNPHSEPHRLEPTPSEL